MNFKKEVIRTKKKVYWTEKSINGNEVHGFSVENDDVASFFGFIVFFLVVLYRLIRFIVKRIIFVGYIIDLFDNYLNKKYNKADITLQGVKTPCY